MDREQFKKWIKIILFVIALAFAGLIVAGIADSSGFVVDNFMKPVYIIIPLFFIAPAGILYIIYMFVEKGELLRKIANILLCVLAIYLFVAVSSNYQNRNKYEQLDNIENQIVSSVFEKTDIEKEDSFLNPFYYSIGKMMVYESENNEYVVDVDNKTKCYIDVYCADNYILGFNRIENSMEHYINIFKMTSRNEITILEEDGTGEYEGLDYKLEYIECEEEHGKWNFIKFAIMITYENSAYLVNIEISNDKSFEVDMDAQAEKIIILLKSNEILTK